MNDNVFKLFIEVMTAAREGRYMFGNGAQWYIVNQFNHKVVIDTIQATTTPCPDYVGTPRVDMDTVYSIERFLKSASQEEAATVEYRYYDAKSIVKEAVNSNNLLFTNGNQWYVRVATNYVLMVTLGIQTSHVTVYAMNMHASWVYMQENNRPCILTDATRKYMGF